MMRTGDRRRWLARLRRRGATPAERYAWRLLRGRKLLGMEFRRQPPVAGFVVDFMCLEHRLVLELDGSHHRNPEHAARDRHRDAILRAHGYTVIHLSNRDVSAANLENAIRHALPNLAVRPPCPATGEGVRG